MAPKRPTVLKTTTRAASGGAILVGAILMFLLFRGSGLGIGVDSPGEAEDSAATDDSLKEGAAKVSTELASVGSTSPSTGESGTDTSPEADNPELTRDEQVATSQKTLGILIDERDFLLRIPGSPQDIFRPSSLERLTELAQMVPGDTNGIRVTILRRETARTTAEQELKQALTSAGIGPDAFYMPNDFVP